MAWSLSTLETWESDATGNNGTCVLAKNMVRVANGASGHRWTSAGQHTSTDITHADGQAIYGYDGFIHVPTYSGTVGVASLYYNVLLVDADIDCIVIKPTSAFEAQGTCAVQIADDAAFSTNLRTICNLDFFDDSLRLVSLQMLDGSAVAGHNRYGGVTYLRFRFQLSSGNWTTAPRIGEFFVGRRRQLGWKSNRPYDDEMDAWESEDFTTKSGIISSYVFHEGRIDKRGQMTLIEHNRFGGNDISIARNLMLEARRNTVVFFEDPGSSPEVCQFGKFLMNERNMPLVEPYERTWDFEFREIPPFMRDDLVVTDTPPYTPQYALRVGQEASLGQFFDSYTDYGRITSLNGAAAATWAGWFLLSATSWDGLQQPLWTCFGDNQNQFALQKVSLGRIQVQIPASLTSSSQSWLSASSTFVHQVWYHYVIVFDGAGAANADRLKIYINGVAITALGTFSGTIPATLSSPTTGTYRIGNYYGASEVTPNDVTIHDENAIWPGFAASAAQAAEIYNAGVPFDLTTVSFADPTHWWQHERNLKDSVGSADGTTQSGGAASFVAGAP